MDQKPQTARERAVLLLRATFLPGWHPTPSQRLVWAIRGAIVLGVAALIASAVDKTLWDWLGLLIVPAVLAIGGYLLSSSQSRATQAAAEQRAQDEALQAYLDQMSQLLLDKKLRTSEDDSEVRSLARARTLTLLPRLDGGRKGRVVQFLYEAGLIAADRPILDLNSADLYDAHLAGANLAGANLAGANLRDANLREAYLYDADLHGAKLIQADLSGTNLIQANLAGANLRDANLSAVYLSGAILFEANLSGVKLTYTDLSGVDLFRVGLVGANLRDAYGVTNEELEQRVLNDPEGSYDESVKAKIFKGAIMPDGQKYEDWLKSKGSGEDEDGAS